MREKKAASLRHHMWGRFYVDWFVARMRAHWFGEVGFLEPTTVSVLVPSHIGQIPLTFGTWQVHKARTAADYWDWIREYLRLAALRESGCESGSITAPFPDGRRGRGGLRLDMLWIHNESRSVRRIDGLERGKMPKRKSLSGTPKCLECICQPACNQSYWGVWRSGNIAGILVAD